jgi:hypothetical protein
LPKRKTARTAKPLRSKTEKLKENQKKTVKNRMETLHTCQRLIWQEKALEVKTQIAKGKNKRKYKTIPGM